MLFLCFVAYLSTFSCNVQKNKPVQGESVEKSPYLTLFPHPTPQAPDNIIHFKENSLEMTEQGKQRLALFCARYDSLKARHSVDVNLISNSLKSEVKLNQNIDILRCKVVAQYMVSYDRISVYNVDINISNSSGHTKGAYSSGPFVHITMGCENY